MEIRPYAATDREACLAVCDSIGHDRSLLEKAIGEMQFFVAEHDGAIIGCGGFAIDGTAARLLHGMVHRDWQRQGLGRFLLFYRLREISKSGAVTFVTATPPDDAIGFFEKQGFRRENGVLTKKLTVCT
jgi:N-acetylglutamate synthase-like GNAT family acetyltransferase